MKKILLYSLFLILLCGSVFGAEVVKYVDTGSTGGDGTTAALSGANAAYATLAAWNLDNDFTDLVSDQDTHVVHVQRTGGGGVDTTAAAVASWTTDATYFITIIGDDFPEDGIFDGTKYHLNVTGNALSLSQDYTVVKNMQITGTTNAIIGGAVGVFIDSCILNGGGCIYATGTDTTMVNCTGEYTGTYGYRVQSGILNLYNCSVWGDGAGVGYYKWATTFNIVNCTAGNTADDFGGLGQPTVINYCVSDDGDGTNALDAVSGDWDNEFVDANNGDFTPVAGGNILVAGLNDPSTGLFSTDIIGASYVTDTWSRNAYAGVPASGISTGFMMISKDFWGRFLQDGINGKWKMAA